MATGNEGNARSQEAEKRRPAFEARYGSLRASVWRQESDKGVWFNVTLSRSYKDEFGAWQSSSSFGARDLLAVAKLCSDAHTWIYRELANERAQSEQDINTTADDEVSS